MDDVNRLGEVHFRLSMVSITANAIATGFDGKRRVRLIPWELSSRQSLMRLNLVRFD